MADGFRVLDDRIARLRILVDLPEEAAPEVAKGIARSIDKQIAAGTDPNGVPWERRQANGGKPLQNVARHVKVGVIGKTVIARIVTKHAVLHHFGLGTVFSRYSATPAYPATDWNGSLAAYAGKEIRLRWRIGSDSTGTGKGMWVDDVAVTDAVFRSTCTSGSAPTPGEVASILPSRGAGSAVDVTFSPTCGATDHAAFWGTGPISGAAQCTASACGLGTSGGASFDPGDPAPGLFFYFGIVGQDGTREGSFGSSSAGERPEAQGIGSCDRLQSLGGGCP